MSGGGGQQPTFQGFLKASGQTKAWNSKDKEKLDQFGWDTRANGSTYSSDTLIGNWNEERFDVSKLAEPRCLPSQYDHYFETSYRQAYSKSPSKVPECLRYSRGDEPSAFPAHQPVLDPPGQKHNSFLTSSMEAYGIPEERRKRGREEREKREGEERTEGGGGGGGTQN